MKQLILLFMLIPIMATGQLVQFNSITTEVTDVTGNYDSFQYDWSGTTSQSNQIVMLENDVGMDLAGLNLRFRMSMVLGTGNVVYVNVTNINLNASNDVRFAIANTNIPPNNTYWAELWAFSGANTNQSKSLSQGMITIFNSLYRDDGSDFPFPAVTFGLNDITDVDTTGVTNMQALLYNATTGLWEPGVISTGGNFVASIATAGGFLTNSGLGNVTITLTSTVLDNTFATDASLTITSNGLQATITTTSNDLQTAITATEGDISTLEGYFTAGLANDSELLDGEEGVYYIAAENQTGVLATAVQDGITGVGTLTGGTWNAAVVDEAYLDANVAFDDAANEFTLTNYFTDIDGSGQLVFGSGLDTTNIGSPGASQWGVNAGTMTIGANSDGAVQRGQCGSGTRMVIGGNSRGAGQFGATDTSSTATNDGIGALQLFNLESSQDAFISIFGEASIGLGACEVTNSECIVAGDGGVSHGDGSITATNGFWGAWYGDIIDKEYLDREAIFGNILIDAIDTTTLTVADTYYQIDGWTTNDYNGVTMSVADEMTILTTGVYAVSARISGYGGTVARTNMVSVFNEGVAEPLLIYRHTQTTAGEIGCHSLGGTVRLDAGDTLDLRALSHGGGGSYIVERATFSVTKKGN